MWALSACHFLLFLLLLATAAGRESPRNLAARSRRYFRLSFANTLLLGVFEASVLCAARARAAVAAALRVPASPQDSQLQ